MTKFISILSVLLMLIAVSIYAARDEATARAIWTFDEGDAADTSGNDVNGTFAGEPEVVDGIVGKALQFDGVDDGVKLPDSNGLNTGGPFTDRTIAAYFKCSDVSITDHKQTIFDEGGRTRGFVVNVFDGQVYVGAWNRAEYQWAGAWPSAPVESDKWYHVALVLRNTTNAVEDDKFEMWLNGEMIASEPGGQLFAHGDDTGIAHTNANAVFHDDDGAGTNIHYFGGVIDEVIVYNSAFDADDFAEYAEVIQATTSVEPQGKFTTTWGTLKAQRTRQ
ncbi:LamG domain-containing protein [Candidatus Poribacteria bacterium]|nr:LamG domain-containing protein [Candidatus Poribacteria bacterium]